VNDDDDRSVLALPGLPVAMREEAGFRIDLKQPGFGGRDIEPPGHKSRDNGHGVAVFQKRVRLKRRNWLIHTRTVFHQGSADKSKATARRYLDADQSEDFDGSTQGAYLLRR
jgi:hypothetical protein